MLLVLLSSSPPVPRPHEDSYKRKLRRHHLNLLHKKVDFDHEALRTIEQIIKRRGRGRNAQVLVKWLNWSKTFNSWIQESEIVDL